MLDKGTVFVVMISDSQEIKMPKKIKNKLRL